MLRAEEVMTTKVVTIHPEATIREAIELLINLRISGLPVVDKQNHLVGILTEFALLALAYDEDIANQTVEQHMTKEVLTVETDTVVNKIADMCIVHRVRRLPVLEGDKLVGMVSRRDVLQALYEAEAPVVTA